MIGNGRRGGGTERDRDMEEDEDEGREERSSEGGGGGGFGGWRSHLLGGLTQRVKSWYWGARPLVSLNLNEPPTHESLPRTDTSFFLFRSSLCLSIFLLIFLFPFSLFYFTFKASLVLLYFKISILFSFFLCSPMSFAKRFESRANVSSRDVRPWNSRRVFLKLKRPDCLNLISSVLKAA